MSELIHYPAPDNYPSGVPLSFAVAHAGILHISGLPGRGADGTIPADFASQFANIVEGFRLALTQTNAGFEDLIETSVLLTRAGDVAEMNALYASAFGPPPYPARITSIVAGLPHPDLLIEIRGTARLPAP